MGETGGRERDNEDLPHPAQPGGAGGRWGGERGERETMSITLGGTLGRSSDWLSGRECIDPNRCVCLYPSMFLSNVCFCHGECPCVCGHVSVWVLMCLLASISVSVCVEVCVWVCVSL